MAVACPLAAGAGKTGGDAQPGSRGRRPRSVHRPAAKSQPWGAGEGAARMAATADSSGRPRGAPGPQATQTSLDPGLLLSSPGYSADPPALPDPGLLRAARSGSKPKGGSGCALTPPAVPMGHACTLRGGSHRGCLKARGVHSLLSDLHCHHPMTVASLGQGLHSPVPSHVDGHGLPMPCLASQQPLV